MLRIIQQAFSIAGMGLALMGWGHALPSPDPATPKKLEISPIAVPIVQNFTLRGYHAFDVHVTYAPSAQLETIKRALPWLIDTLITTTYKASYALWAPDLPLDKTLLDSLIQLELSQLKLPAGFEGITITSFRALDPQGRDLSPQKRVPQPARGTAHATATP